ncbi:hypothetical protein FB451DRAFT_1397136 [Mycena latifolia]|nr:hypothetical protein FB451DRAFT_1397136 [Mycena latifolia]
MPAIDWKPKRTLAECNDILCNTPGSLWETARGVVDGRLVTYYKNLPGETAREFWLNSKVHGPNDYLVYEKERYTYAQSHKIVAQAAQALLNVYGVKKGDRVAILLRNYPEWIFCFWAAHILGAVPVAINAWVSSEQMAHCLRDCGAKVLFAEPERTNELKPFSKTFPSLQGIIAVRVPSAETIFWDAKLAKGVATWDKLIAGQPKTVPDAAVGPEDMAAIYYTSGTTGMPKGVPCTNRMFQHGLLNNSVNQARAKLRRGEDLNAPVDPNAGQKAVLMPAPLFHVTGSQNILPAATFLGGKLIMMYKWSVPEALRILAEEKVTWYTGVPFITREVIDAGLSAKICPTLESFGFGGAPTAPKLVYDAVDAFPNVSPSHSYGMTEYFTVCASVAGEDFVTRPTSAGLPTPVTEMAIVDPVTETELPTRSVGEVWFRGPSVAHGYLNLPEATQKAFTRDGWYKTGDVGWVDEEGFLYLTDRIKDLIIRGGENIPSIDIEIAILRDERVQEAAAVAIKHRSLGEEICAVVTAKPGKSITIADVNKICEANLKKMWRPAYVIIYDEALPKNANGKVEKKLLRVMAQEKWNREHPKAKL